MRRSTVGSYIAPPSVIVLLLVVANVVQYLLCFRVAGGPVLSTPVLVAEGALIPAAPTIPRTVALLGCGLPPRGSDASPGQHGLASHHRTVPRTAPGATTFALIYFVTLIGAGLASLLLHREAFVGVGASGAIFGILGALFALWALGAEELSPGFFLVNFGLNFGISARDPRVDWAAHTGGFIAGMACVALLDIVSRANLYWLRCKFPEFVKMNAALLMGAGAAWLWFHPPNTAPHDDPRLIMAMGGTLATLCFVKVMDLLLAVRHGLVGVVLVFVASNAAAALMSAELLRPALALQCGSVMAFGTPAGGIAAILCPNLADTGAALAGGTILLTLLSQNAQLRRGLRDVGFVGATFMGDRRRERGLVRPVRHTRA